MPEFSVTWTPSAEADLARLWQLTADRPGLTALVSLLENGLSHAPRDRAALSVEELWFRDEGSPRACYVVNEPAHSVRVVGVGLLLRRS